MAGTMAASPRPDMELTPKRVLAIKRALIRQYADQYGLEIDGWTEEIDGKIQTVRIINDEAVVVSVRDA
ncbi:hypothetical protein [uncultured Acetatifactor sp.]|jgi:hypothetical protein|uniref:hypothetical protein n=1 Tax=uncultured Acetatifactor sp. TaxID=1671927 RepID=UPI002623B33C|nr:hypothetical protein [uncultured Acetatifactor sp.]